nr:glycosyltransferase family 4 protein [uncultured Sellimonas sp.]
MKIIFLTLLDFQSYSDRNIYCDLLREFIKNGHEVYCISPAEKRTGIETHFEENGRLLKLKIGNTQKTNIVEKGISTMLIEPQFVSAVKKYFANIKFDFVLYSTPPITFANAVSYIKKRDGAKTYLMLKDIFPQNAVDLGMMKTNGFKSLIYKYFRKKEKELYALSDCIGCMSPENVNYILKHNPEIEPEKVEVCPNCIDVIDMRIEESEKVEIRKKYEIPLDKKVFVYGGNLGKPQGVSYIIKCLKAQLKNLNAYFLIVGDGTEFSKLEKFFYEAKPQNMRLLKKLPKEDYDKLVAACDIGMIFLDYRFTIPNFPSRLLSYMQAGLPVLACTDKNTDVGKVIVDGGFGWWCESNNVKDFNICIDEILSEKTNKGIFGYKFLKNMYSTEKAYSIIIKSNVK